jgi:hypothetical protein
MMWMPHTIHTTVDMIGKFTYTNYEMDYYIYGSFNNTASNLDYTALNDWMISKQHNRKNVEGSRHGLTRRAILAFAWRG